MIKSLVFNIVFFAYTIFICTFLAFTFILPRKTAFFWVRKLYFQGIAVIERIFLGLNYRVSGRENIPAEGSYILALKHYSAYETLKLPNIFGDVAIIMKRELTWIPLWGWYTIKLGNIAVDRGARNKAVASLLTGAKRVIAQGRPILIFPQGTRVPADANTKDYPYKVGTAKMAEALKLPVVPVALNSGAFWPKHSFIKKSGTVDFKILPVIPAGLPPGELLQRLEASIEPESAKLMANADIRGGMPFLTKLFIALFLIWAAWWQGVAYLIKDRLAFLPTNITTAGKPSVSGFPFRMHIQGMDVQYQSETGSARIPVADMRVWPVPAGSGTITTPQGFAITATRDGKPVTFTSDFFALKFRLPVMWRSQDSWAIVLKGIDVTMGETALHGTGDVSVLLNGGPVNGVMDLTITGYDPLLGMLVQNNMIDEDKARLASGFLNAMASAQQTTGTIAVPLKFADDVVYLGFIRLVDLKAMRPQGDVSARILQKIRSGDLETNGLPAPVRQIQAPAAAP